MEAADWICVTGQALPEHLASCPVEPLQLLLLFSLYWCISGGSETLTDLPRVTQQVNGSYEPQVQTCLNLQHLCFLASTPPPAGCTPAAHGPQEAPAW